VLLQQGAIPARDLETGNWPLAQALSQNEQAQRQLCRFATTGKNTVAIGTRVRKNPPKGKRSAQRN